MNDLIGRFLTFEETLGRGLVKFAYFVVLALLFFVMVASVIGGIVQMFDDFGEGLWQVVRAPFAFLLWVILLRVGTEVVLAILSIDDNLTEGARAQGQLPFGMGSSSPLPPSGDTASSAPAAPATPSPKPASSGAAKAEKTPAKPAAKKTTKAAASTPSTKKTASAAKSSPASARSAAAKDTGSQGESGKTGSSKPGDDQAAADAGDSKA